MFAGLEVPQVEGHDLAAPAGYRGFEHHVVAGIAQARSPEEEDVLPPRHGAEVVEKSSMSLQAQRSEPREFRIGVVQAAGERKRLEARIGGLGSWVMLPNSS